MNDMTTILVTGPIGSGKSEACRHLAGRGIPVYDCDSRAKALYDSVPGLKSRIEKELDIRFEELAVIFNDADRKSRLEALLYPLVAEDIRIWLSGLDTQIAVVESATALGRAEFKGMFDKVLLITAPAAARETRNAKARQRDAFQHFDESSADWTIRNDGDRQELFDKLDTILP